MSLIRPNGDILVNAVFITVCDGMSCYRAVDNRHSMIRAAGVDTLAAFFLAFMLLR